jgi:hypothetical protein
VVAHGDRDPARVGEARRLGDRAPQLLRLGASA